VYTEPSHGWKDTNADTAELTASNGVANDYLGDSVAVSVPPSSPARVNIPLDRKRQTSARRTCSSKPAVGPTGRGWRYCQPRSRTMQHVSEAHEMSAGSSLVYGEGLGPKT